MKATAAAAPPNSATQRSIQRGAAAQASNRTAQRNHHPRALPISAADLPPHVVRIRDLAHIQSMGRQVVARSREANEPIPVPVASASASATGQAERKPVRYEISQMPIAEVIEMVSGLLTKIMDTNDQQFAELHRRMAHQEAAANAAAAAAANDLDSVAAMVLAFHGKNVPAISIFAYLIRIEKYCPTTYEVFLSLLVYFDRMTAAVNSRGLRNLRRQAGLGRLHSAGEDAPHPGFSEHGHVAAKDDEHVLPPEVRQETGTGDDAGGRGGEDDKEQEGDHAEVPDLSNFFVVDSYNIHRLVIASVAAASKFFSDIFYTNTRLASKSIPSLSSITAARGGSNISILLTIFLPLQRSAVSRSSSSTTWSYNSCA